MKPAMFTKDTLNSQFQKIDIKRILLGFAIGIAVSGGVFSIFLLTQGQNPVNVFVALVECFTQNKYNVGEIWVQMTPILIAGMAALIPAKVGIINCGGEGQLIAGALAANITGVYLCAGWPGYLGIPMMMLTAILAGVVWGAIPLFCKMVLNMNETLSTLLMNYIMTRLVAFMIFGPIQDVNGNNYPMSAKIASQLRLPTFAGTRANFTIFFAIALAILIWYFFSKTELGFKMRAIGGNERAAMFAGYSVKKIQCMAFLVAAGLSGLAGGIVMSGVEFQMRESTASGLGFMGFLATGIVNNNPILSILSSMMLSALSVCGTTLEINTGLRSAASVILMSIILLTIFGLGRRKSVQ